ncbi:MAG: hypothetical protein ACR2QT_10230 [Woeseiaceae bacterium]
MTNEEKDEEMICGLTADERDELRRGLDGLTDTMPPRIVWNRIREQAEAEGLIRTTITQRPSTWFGGFAIAAAVVLAVIMLPKVMTTSDVGSLTTEPPATAQNDQIQVTALQALMVQSRQLESDLRALPDEPRVMRASTIATISDIENAIASIDYQLNDSGVQMTPDERELFWRERVRLMKSLVQLRYAQAQRTAF